MFIERGGGAVTVFTICPQDFCSRQSMHFDGHTIRGAADGGGAHSLRLDLRGWAGHLNWSSPPQQRQHVAVILKYTTTFKSLPQAETKPNFFHH